MTDAATQEWFTTAEIEGLALPGLPKTRRGIDKLAFAQGWRDGALARRRAGRGGGFEYHISVLPVVAQARLRAADTRAAGGRVAEPALDWSAFEGLPDTAKQKARDQLRAIKDIELLERGGLTRHLAVTQVAKSTGVSTRTLWGWLAKVQGLATSDRLPALAPKHRTAARKKLISPFDEAAFDALYADFMRPEQSSFSECFRRTRFLASEHDWSMPSERTARRQFDRQVPAPAVILARKGIDALKRMYPPQDRDKSDLHALECVNADGHRFDVFVEWPDGSIHRPMMTAWHDVYSGLMLSWRIDVSENRISALLSFGDMIEKFGIPVHAVFDNGRGWASKWLTGGTPTRYRFKVRDDDPLGVLPQLGIELHWTLPYSGQSKPIERAFRDLTDSIARHPRLSGAYTGNSPMAKPENYGSRAVPLEEFLEVTARGIAEHNTRVGRRSPIAAGRSFQQTFDESYADAIIRKASPEQRRLWLLGAEGLRGAREEGALSLMGSRFWSEWCWKLRGEKVIGRFDPEDLSSGLHVYALDGQYLGHAEMIEKGKFLSLDDAQSHARSRKQYMNAVKRMETAQRSMTTKELAASHASIDAPTPTDEPRSKVVRPVFNGSAAQAVAVEDVEEVDSDLSWFRKAHAEGVKLSIVKDEED